MHIESASDQPPESSGAPAAESAAGLVPRDAARPNSPDDDQHSAASDPPPTSDCAIRIERLTKIYDEDRKSEKIVAVRDLNLQIPKGEVYGLIGPNGAGKSSLMQMMATLLAPSFGRIEVCGFDTWSERDEVCQRLGFMPELFHLYEELTVEEYLEFFAGAYGVERSKRQRVIEDVIELTDLGIRRKSMSGSLSKGMRQRLLLAKTMIHDPDVLILDEPTSGMDPQARIEFRNIVKTLARMKKTIIISSHILPDLSSFCSSFGIMEQGRMRISGTFEEVSRALQMTDRVEVEFLGSPEAVSRYLDSCEHANSPKHRGGGVSFGFDGSQEDLANILRGFHEAGIPVTHFVRRKTDLEEMFLQIGADKVQ